MKRAVVLLALAALRSRASADKPIDRPQAIDVDRGDTPAGRTELGFDGGAPVTGFGITLATTWLEEPIAFGDIRPVRRRETVMLGGAIALGTSIVLDAQVAAAHQIGERLGDGTDLDRWVATDPRVGARIHVVGNAMRAAFVRVDLALPTGDDGDFAGDASWALAWRLIGRIRLGTVTLAATAGIRLRGQEVIVGDRLVGDEGIFGVGAIVQLPALRPLWCEEGMKLTAEVTGILGNDVGMGQGPSPVEARVGVVARPSGSVTIGVRAGRGLTEEIGAPSSRVTVELTYQR
ncbi:MAG: hypothetical protein M4D80_04185 [Myxococcota bacterium]|nr:hypothetical protein [Myxococcota bacterium]